MQNGTTERNAGGQDSERALTFRLLHESPVVAVRDYRCMSCRGGPSKEEASDSNNIVLLRRGVFCKHHGRQGVSIDVNQASFFSKGSPYRVSHLRMQPVRPTLRLFIFPVSSCGIPACRSIVT